MRTGSTSRYWSADHKNKPDLAASFAKQWIDRYHAKAAQIKQELIANGKQTGTATVLQFMNKQVFAYFENIAITVYQTLGFVVPPKVKEMNKGNTTGYAKLSMEVLPDFSADRIFVIDDGRIVEEGNSDELLAKKGQYYNLYMAQFKNL